MYIFSEHIERSLLFQFPQPESTNRKAINPIQTMSGSAAPKMKKGQTTFDPDFKAKGMTERDDTWFQERYGPKMRDEHVSGGVGESSKSVGKGKKNKDKKSGVRNHPAT